MEGTPSFLSLGHWGARRQMVSWINKKRIKDTGRVLFQEEWRTKPARTVRYLFLPGSAASEIKRRKRSNRGIYAEDELCFFWGCFFSSFDDTHTHTHINIYISVCIHVCTYVRVVVQRIQGQCGYVKNSVTKCKRQKHVCSSWLAILSSINENIFLRPFFSFLYFIIDCILPFLTLSFNFFSFNHSFFK